MTLQKYLRACKSKYAVIRLSSYQADEVAQSLSDSPTQFTIEGVDFVILSLEKSAITDLVSYLESIGSGVEFELTLGSGLVTLLLHSQAKALMEKYNVLHRD